jgi:PAS domain S-box-containing protein
MLTMAQFRRPFRQVRPLPLPRLLSSAFGRLLLSLWDRPLWLRLSLAALAIGAGAASRQMLPVLGLPYLLFIPLIMALGFFLGLWPGLLGAMLSAAAALYLFMDADGLLDISVEQWLGASLYMLVSIGIVAVCAALRVFSVRLQTAAVELEKRAEARTRERDLIWEAAPDMLCTASFDGYLVSINGAWTQTLGWPESDLKAVPYLSFVHPDDIDRTRQAHRAMKEGKAQMGFENRYRCKDGQYCWLSWSAVARDGLIYCNVRDVSQTRQQAEALRRAEEQLRQSQKMEAVGQLTGGLAHDFNNLLTGITGSLDLVKIRLDQGRYGDIPRHLDTAQGAARRAASLTHRLLAFSRRQTLDPTMTDANGLITGMFELIERSVGPSVRTETHLDLMLWTTLCDANQLENAVLNLCLNARDAMPSGGVLTIETQNLRLDGAMAAELELEPADYVCIAVSDTGVGMPPEVVSRAFDPFYTTKPIGLGTGLGLSMIYGFARQSGGRAKILSTPGKGTIVRLYLPRYLGLPASVGPESVAVPRVSAQTGRTVLVVDDEASIRSLIAEILKDLDYVVLEAHDGQSGLQILQSGMPIDLLISDVGLPGLMNGRQMADAARHVRPDLKVLFITGYAEASVIGTGSLSPGMQVLSKPFSMETLCERIDAILD